MMRPGRAAAVCLVLAILTAWVLFGCSARYSVPLASGADLVTTEIALQTPGLAEGNPLAPNSTAGRVAWKVIGTAAVVWICEWLDRNGHRKLSGVLQWTATAAFATAAGWNTYQIQKARETNE